MDSQLCPLQTKKSAVVIRSNSIAKLLLFFAFLLPGVAELSAQNLNITSGTTATFDENATGTVYTAEATSDQFSIFFSLGSSKDESLFSIEEISGLLTFNTPPDFESPQDGNTDNVYEVEIIASDFFNTDESITVSVTVNDVAEGGSALSITSGSTASFDENATGTVYTAEATSDQFSIFFSLGGSKDESLFSIEEISGLLTFNTPPDFESPQDGNADNVYEVEIIASDFANPDASITVSVTVNDVAEGGNALSITSGSTASFDENATGTVYTAEATSDQFSIFFSLGSSKDESLFSIEEISGLLTFNSIPDFESPQDGNADNVYEVEIIASDFANPDASITLSVTVTDVADTDVTAPVFTSGTGDPYNEGDVGTAYTATATDAGTITFTLGTTKDEALFGISNGGITFNSIPDFENPLDADQNNTYLLDVIATDDANNSSTQAITITVENINDNDPVITSNGGGATASIDVAENTTAVTTVTATDADNLGALTFTITGGEDQAFFEIVSGALAFKVAPDFESPGDDGTNNTYEVTVTASDGSLDDAQTIMVTVTDVADTDVTAPVFTSGTGDPYNEGDVGTAYTATATDAGSVTFTLGTTKDEALFGISNGGITFNSIPDFENPLDADQNNTYLLDVIATDDANNSTTQAITITVENINDNDPVITSNGAGATASADVAENTTAVTTVTATDADNLGALTFTITGGADQAFFEIVSGALAFKVAPDFETPADDGTNNTYIVTVTASDGTRTDAQTITVTVTDVQEADVTAPVFTSGTGDPYNEGDVGTAYTATATDAGTITFTLGTTKDEALFGISNGGITFNSIPDFENPLDADQNNTYLLDVIATDDANNSSTQAITITVENINDNDPVIISNGAGATANVNVTENTTAVATVTATDADNLAALTFTITGGADQSLFEINSGALAFKAAPDFENPGDNGADNAYEVVVTVSDTERTDSQTLTVTVTDANDNAPVITSNGGGEVAFLSVAENGTAVTTVTATDVDTNTSLSFSKSGTDGALFTINANTGVLTLINAPDFENPTDDGADNSYVVEVTVSDGTNSDTQTLAVGITDVNDNSPVITSNGGGATSAISVVENTTAVTTVTALDADPTASLTYAKSGTDEALFSIDANTGVLAFITAPDFENPTDDGANNTYMVTVTVSDGTNSDAQDITVTVTDANDNSPVISSNGGGATAAISVAENSTAVTTVTATDVDTNTSLSFSKSGTDADLFTIDANTGVLTFTTAPDFETPADNGADNSYQVNVIASDGTNTDLQAITVTVTGLDDTRPVITSGATATAAENTSGTAIYTITATDVDTDDSQLQFGILGADADKFEVFETNKVRIKNPLDFEKKESAAGSNTFSFFVLTEDGINGVASQEVTISLTDVNEAPGFVPSPSFTIDVNDNEPFELKVITEDPDAGDQVKVSYLNKPEWATVTEAIEEGVGAFDAGATRVSAIDFNSKGEYVYFSTVVGPKRLDHISDYTIGITGFSITKVGSTGTQRIDGTESTGFDENGPVSQDDVSFDEIKWGASTLVFWTALLRDVYPDVYRDVVYTEKDDVFIIDENTIRRLDFTTERMTLFAGGPGKAFFYRSTLAGDVTGNLLDARFNNLNSIVSDKAGNLYVSDRGNKKIKKIDVSSGQVTDFGAAGTFTDPTRLAIDANDNLFVVDGFTIKKITPNGTVSDFIGNGMESYEANSPSIGKVVDMHFDKDNSLWLMEDDTETEGIDSRTGSNRIIRKIDANGTSTVIIKNEIEDINQHIPQRGKFDDTRLGRLAAIAYNSSNDRIVYSENSVNQFSNILLNNTSAINQIVFSRPESISASPTIPVGTYTITARAKDLEGLTTDQVYTINVLDKTAPVINSAVKRSFRENTTGEVYAITVEASNNPNETLTYAFAGGVDDFRFSISATTGKVLLLSPKDFENPDDQGADRTYDLKVQVVDNAGNASAIKDIQLILTNKNENPEFTSDPDPEYLTVKDTETYSYPFTTTDIDGDEVTVTGTNLPDWLKVEKASNGEVTRFARLTTIFGRHLRQDSKGNLWAMSRKWLSRISPNGDVDQIFTLGSDTRILVEGVSLTIVDMDAFAINSRDEVHLMALAVKGNTTVAARVILRLDQNNQWVHVAGALNTTTDEEKDGNPKETFITTGFGGLTGMVFDTQDQLYFTSKNSIRKIANNQVTTVAGQLNVPPAVNPSTDGDAASATLNPNALAVAQDGTVYFSEVYQEKVRKVSPQGMVSTLLTTDDEIRLPFGLFLFDEKQLFFANMGSGFFARSETTSVKKYSLADNSLTTVFSSASFSQNHDVESTNLSDAEFSTINELIALSEDEFIILDLDVIRKINGKTNPDRVTGNAIGRAGTYDIRLLASDGLGGLAEQRYNLTVEDATAPEFNPSTFRFEENFTGEIPYQLTGSDNVTSAEDLKFNTIEGTDAQFFEVSTDGKISVKTAQNKEAPSDANQDGIYELGIAVQDEAGNFSTAFIALEVANKNEAPTFTTEPSAESLIVKDNESFTYAYQTTDPEEDPVTVNGTLPAWLSLQKGSRGALEVIHSGIDSRFQKGDFGFDGNYYSIPGFWGNAVFQTTIDGASSRFATDGSGVYGWMDGDKSEAQFSILLDIRATPDRKALILSDFNKAFRKIDLVTNQVSTLFQWSDPQRPNYVNLTGNANDYVSDFRIKENGNLVFSIGPALTDIYETTASGQLVNIIEGVFSGRNGVFLPLNDGSYYAVDNPSGPNRSRSVVRWQNGVPSALAVLPANFDLNDWIIEGTDVLIAGEDLTNERNIILRLTAGGTLSTEHDWRLDYQGLNMGSLEDAETESAAPRRFMKDQNGALVVSNYPASFQNTNSRILRIDGANVPAGVSGSALDQVGTHEVTLTAADVPFDLKTEQKFTITVVDATAPVFTSANTITVPENSTAPFFTLKATDTNSKATLSYALLQGANADNEKFSVNTSTGEISAIDPLNFESPNDFDEDGIYILDVLVGDGVNVTTQKLTVTLVDANDAPEITSDPVTEVNDNETYNYPFTTADEDGDNVTVTGTDLPDWLQLNNEGDATVSSIAGGGDTPGTDGTGSDASIGAVRDLVTQDNSDFYFLELIVNRSIRKFNLQGEVTTLAGDASQPAGDQDGTGKNARFTFLSSIAFGPDGNLYVSDFNKIKKITLAGEVTTYAGTGSKLIGEAQNLSELKFSGLGALAFDSKGNLFAVEGGSLLVKIETDGTVSKFAGDTEQGYQDGTGLNARFKSIWKLLIDNEDNIFLTDSEEYRVRKVTSDGVVSTIAGSGVQGFEDGNGTIAQFTAPSGLAFDSEGNLLISEGGGIFGGSKVGIRKIDKDGNVTTSFLKDQHVGNVPLTDGGLSQATMTYFYDFVLVGGDIIFGDANRIRRIGGDFGTAGTAAITGDPTGKVGTYNIKLTPNDGTVNGKIQEFTLTVKDATAPTIADIDALSFAENNTSTVVDVNATDTNPNAQITYSLGTGKDEAAFNINATTGVISFATAPDFETPADVNGDNVYLLDVKAGDGINESTVAIQVTVTNVNESPTDLTIATSFDEGVASGQGLSAMLSTDVDAGETFTYSLVAGSGDTDNASFEVNGSTLNTKVDFDFETQGSYDIRLRTTDAGGLTFDKAFVLTINDLNEAPTNITLNNTAIDENNSVDDAIGNLSSTDEDANESHSYALVSGEGDTDNSSFDIVDGALVAKSVFDFETKASHSVRVRTTDKGGLTFDKAFTITINDMNEAPTDITLGLSAIDENNAIDDPVTLFITTDEDPSDTHTYSLVAGEGDTDNASFEALNGGLLAREVFDFETKSSYSIRLKTTDAAGLSFEKSLTITINNVEEAPTDITLDNATIAENNEADAAIGSFTTTDDDNAETFTYSLVAGDGDDDNDDFSIAGADLTVNSALDFETKSSYSLRVRSTDGAGLTFEKTFTISVTDVPEPIIRVEHTDPTEPTGLGFSTTINVEVFNDGDGPLEVSQITYPAGFTGPASMDAIAPMSGSSIAVVFSPTEARAYAGDITFTYNRGVESRAISALGAIITSVDNGQLDAKKITLYPNPSTREFTLDLSAYNGAPVAVGIVSPSGATVFMRKEVSTSHYKVDVSTYEQGTYFVMIQSARQTIVKKLIIRR